ncbi:prepilin peptidase [Candidatus Woesearchaeota archaeon]|nr:prepilin peptidase [Candidatus Woesearchaeota archaeon]
MLPYLIIAVVLIALIIGSYTDFKCREVPDYVSYSLIIACFGLTILHSILAHDVWFLLTGIISFLIIYGLAYLLFLTGQWGGGDAKILMGLGAGLANVPSLPWFAPRTAIPLLGTPPFLVTFFINLLFVGALYGIAWCIYLIVKNHQQFIEQCTHFLTKNIYFKIIHPLLAGALLITIVVLQSPLPFLLLLLIFFILPYLWLSLKIIEESCMIHHVAPAQLTEGDWIVEDIVVDKKYITGPKELGVSREQIKQLLHYKKIGKIRTIKIKVGIPFVPAFLIAVVVSLVMGNIAAVMLTMI